VLAQVTPDDVLEYGMIPELVGRLPGHHPAHAARRDGPGQILTEPKNALVKQYQHLFEMEALSSSSCGLGPITTDGTDCHKVRSP
jgi:ATP-dependent Clp protease ATP-binding subunit ClpX